ncbi:CYTH and CHAD domain-containing protein [Gordonia sp. (in: high G+C Gram-positive bacteria)]|uniref:CYTH and CHAD domain-containing protein n=1 Tax=Gordonia sp. (in: high G+C Gram-positive bacteria) TaxID=84139 RepID=UPI0016969346|nr:CYTH and CHAD domain-containing protein [Gordonia sp. (in: high G+C Gram-positive bacteria)]NLG46924.1 CYTH and CHAD domain-containing protein [Gordonia sp. (in: high G+C Gram-positive bacteria)]
MSPSHSIEVELKFDVDAGLPAPDLNGLTDGCTVGEPATYLLEATYFDTADTLLAKNRMTLRRRTGGTDAGWHLKRPSSVPGGRKETAVDFGEGSDDVVPAALRAQILTVIRSAELVPVATITTDRTVTTVLDAQGTPLAEFCEDVVSAESLLPGGGVNRWAEWEFELVGGDAALLKRAKHTLRSAGAREASSVSKLARAIGTQPHDDLIRALPKKASALGLVQYDLASHRDDLHAWDPLARENAHDAVHQMRIAARKIRSILRSYPGVIAPEMAAPVADELRLLGEVLGDARDREVRLATNELLLAREDAPADLVKALVDDERDGHQQALKALRFALSTQRYITMLDDLDRLITAPIPGPMAERPARDIAADAVGGAYSRMVKAEKKLRKYTPWSPEWMEQLHTIRKRAKALRYTAESAAPLNRRALDRAGAEAKKVQTYLGDFNDTVVNRRRLTEIATDPSLSPEAVFVLGRIDAHEESRGRRAVKKYRRAR